MLQQRLSQPHHHQLHLRLASPKRCYRHFELARQILSCSLRHFGLWQVELRLYKIHLYSSNVSEHLLKCHQCQRLSRLNSSANVPTCKAKAQAYFFQHLCKIQAHHYVRATKFQYDFAISLAFQSAHFAFYLKWLVLIVR